MYPGSIPGEASNPFHLDNLLILPADLAMGLNCAAAQIKPCCSSCQSADSATTGSEFSCYPTEFCLPTADVKAPMPLDPCGPTYSNWTRTLVRLGRPS